MIDAIEVVSTELTTADNAELVRYEAVIQRGLETFLDVGRALIAIRDGSLYRATHGSFDEYCRERWNISRKYAYRTINAAMVIENLSPIGDILPANEAQARPLAKLEPDQQRQAWADAVEDADGGKVTAAHVEKAVAKFAEPKPAPTRAEVKRLRDEGKPKSEPSQAQARAVYVEPKGEAQPDFQVVDISDAELAQAGFVLHKALAPGGLMYMYRWHWLRFDGASDTGSWRISPPGNAEGEASRFFAEFHVAADPTPSAAVPDDDGMEVTHMQWMGILPRQPEPTTEELAAVAEVEAERRAEEAMNGELAAAGYSLVKVSKKSWRWQLNREWGGHRSQHFTNAADAVKDAYRDLADREDVPIDAGTYPADPPTEPVAPTIGNPLGAIAPMQAIEDGPDGRARQHGPAEPTSSMITPEWIAHVLEFYAPHSADLNTAIRCANAAQVRAAMATLSTEERHLPMRLARLRERLAELEPDPAIITVAFPRPLLAELHADLLLHYPGRSLSLGSRNTLAALVWKAMGTDIVAKGEQE